MNKEFTIVRVEKYLNEYILRINNVFELFENKLNTDEELDFIVLEIRKDILKEMERAVSRSNGETDQYIYIPALKEALKFIDESLNIESSTKFATSLYEASSSLEHYLHQIQT